MSANDKILVIIEPDIHPEEVASRAAWLAEIAKCELEFLLCDPDVGALREGLLFSNEAHDLAEKIRQAQAEILDDLAEPVRKRGIVVNARVLEERPIADGVLHHARELQPRFVLKGTHYHTSAERSIFVDTDWQLVRSCPYPLWLVKPHAMQEEPVIVAAVDPTHSHDKPAALDQVIVEAAQSLQRASGGELHLIHTYHRLIGVGREATRTFKPIKLPIDELSKKIQEDHRAQLGELATKYEIDAEHTHQLPGDAKEILPTFTRAHGADVLVMGAIARWGLKRAVLGSTAEKVLDHLPCDILIVRTSDD